MQRTVIILGLLACLSASGANAGAQSSPQEAAGVGIGATLGAVAGGPVGAIIGAAIGAKLGDNYHRKAQQVAALSVSLQAANARRGDLQRTIAALNEDIETMGGNLERLREVARPELIALLQTGIEMDLLFRTDERVLSESTRERLRALATSLAAMPEVRIQLDGFADERGDETYNNTLSADRAAHVRDLLLQNGVAASRISSSAHGESPASEASADSYALERRVSMTLYVEDTPSFAATPE